MRVWVSLVIDGNYLIHTQELNYANNKMKHKPQ